jgi:hypothetical protein
MNRVELPGPNDWHVVHEANGFRVDRNGTLNVALLLKAKRALAAATTPEEDWVAEYSKIFRRVDQKIIEAFFRG